MDLLEYAITIIIVGLIALLLDQLSYKSLESFFLWLLIVMTFFVYAGMLELWMLIILIILNVFIVSISLYRNKNNIGV